MTFALDAWAILAYLQGEEPAASRVRSRLHDAEANSHHFIRNVIAIALDYNQAVRTAVLISA